MDADAQEEIVKRINPQRGIESELNRVLGNNEALSKSDSWDSATRRQKSAIRDRITANDTKESLKFQKNGKTFVRVDQNNYKRVTSNDDVLVNERTGQVFLRDSSGKVKEVIK